MSTTQYWAGTTLVVDWSVTTPDGGTVADATVTGEIRLPDDSTTGWDSINWIPDDAVYRAVFTPTLPGRHGWRLAADGTATGAVEGWIVVQRSTVGLPPITVDPQTPIGRVRLLATDLDETTPLLSDTQIQAMLGMCADRIRRAAAMALDTIASSEALVSKRIKTLDLTTDGPAVAKALRDHAQRLREEDDDLDDDGPWGLDIVHYDPWAAYRRSP